MKKCGWDPSSERFSKQFPDTYDLYGEWALHLGSEAKQQDADVSKLSVAVAPVNDGEFYHFGKTVDVIESMYGLQMLVNDQTALGASLRWLNPNSSPKIRRLVFPFAGRKMSSYGSKTVRFPRRGSSVADTC